MITKIKIKNFGSIKEEQTIKVNKDITSLIGKNESGKSTALRAIEKLNDGKILDSEKNVLSRNEESYIEGTYRLDKEAIIKINQEHKTNTNYNLYSFPEEYDCLYFTKKIVDNSTSTYYGIYYLSKDKKGNMIVENNISGYFVDNIKNKIKEILGDSKGEQVKTFFKEIKKMNEDELKDKLITLAIDDEELKNEITSFSSEIIKNKWISMLPKYKFISFSSFRDILKDNIIFSELDSNIQAKNILSIANIDVEKLGKAFEEVDETTLQDMETEYLEVVSKKFKEIFQQTDENFKLKIRFGTNKNEIIFLTQDKTSGSKSINLSQRSDGFKWYLSLYLTLYDYLERSNEDDNIYILLLDEPNLYLHPGAQRNLIQNVFYKEFQNIQIIYTTHSPYMIDSDNSYSIRIVEKDNGTKIYNSPRDYSNNHLKLDVDTMTPLLTALDLSISNDLIINQNDKIFVVEGIQDVYVLRGLINKLNYSKKMSRIKFISSTSANKVPFMYSYLFGMGYDVYSLVDNDTPGNKANRTIVDNSDDTDLYNKLLTYDLINETPTKKLLLEDLFSEDDKLKYFPEKNTIYHKRIYDNNNDYDFTSQTKANFKKLFDLLISKTK